MKFISNLTKDSTKKFEYCCKKIDPNCKIDIRKELYDCNGNRWNDDNYIAFYLKSNIIKDCVDIMKSEYYKNYEKEKEMINFTDIPEKEFIVHWENHEEYEKFRDYLIENKMDDDIFVNLQLNEHDAIRMENNVPKGFGTKLFYLSEYLYLKIYEVKNINFNKNEEEKIMETKYELIKKLSGKEIVKDACEGQFEIFVKKFGFYDEVEWTKENEEWISGFIAGGIEFGIKYGFLRERETIKFDENKVYILKNSMGSKTILNILIKNENGAYIFTPLNNTCVIFDDKSFMNPHECIKEYHNKYSNWEIKEFNNIREAIDFYYLKEEKSIANMTKIEKINLLHDLVGTLNVKSFDSSGCPVSSINFIEDTFCAGVECSMCKFNNCVNK